MKQAGFAKFELGDVDFDANYKRLLKVDEEKEKGAKKSSQEKQSKDKKRNKKKSGKK